MVHNAGRFVSPLESTGRRLAAVVVIAVFLGIGGSVLRAQDAAAPPAAPAMPAAPVPAVASLKQSGSYLNASGEMCNQIRGPWGVKEDCRPPASMYGGRASLPTPKQLEMKSKY